MRIRTRRRLKKFLVWLIGAIILSGGFALAISNDISETDFCREKVEKHFPEYKFEKFEYSSLDRKCIGRYLIYEEEQEIRNGLEVVRGSKTEKIEFKLINEKDINHLTLDDGWEFLAIFCLVMFLGWSLVLINW